MKKNLYLKMHLRMRTLLRMIMITNLQLFNQTTLHDLIKDLDYQKERPNF